MGFNLGELYATVVLDTSKYRRELSELPKEADKSFGQVAQSAEFNFKKIAGYAATYLAARRLFSFGGDAVREFSDLEEARNQFKNIFKDIPASAEKASKELQKSFVFSEQGAKNALSASGDLLVGFGLSQEAALDLSFKVAKLGADLASFKNYAGGARGAAEALTVAMLGETERAKALGIVIRQDSKEFKELVEHFKIAENATEIQARAMAVYEMAAKQSANAIGDLAREGETIAQTQLNIKKKY